VEASALPAQVGLPRTRIALGAPLLRLRSDEQLVSLFRAGSDDAFRVIHDRYRQRLYAYTRQMLSGSPADPEDAVQEIFVRAYAGLRAGDRHLALRAWLYRVAHNRCIDDLRRPQAIASDWVSEALPTSIGDPVASLERRDALQRLISDVRRLPEQQRSALLMRELGGMPYVDVAGALGVTVPAVKSLLVRARVSLAQANQARDTECADIRAELVVAHDRGVRSSGLARRHMHDCSGCREFRSDIRGVSRQLAAFVPTLGPLGLLASFLGLGGAGSSGAAAGGGAVTGSGVTASGVTATGAAVSGITVSAGAITGAGHVVTLLAAAVVTAGGAIELQHIAHPIAAPSAHHQLRRVLNPDPLVAGGGARSPAMRIALQVGAPAAQSATADVPVGTAQAGPAAPGTQPTGAGVANVADTTRGLPITETMDPDHLPYLMTPPATPSPSATGGSPASSSNATSTTAVSSPDSAGGGSAATGTAAQPVSAPVSTPGATSAGAPTTSPNDGTSSPVTSPGAGSSSTASRPASDAPANVTQVSSSSSVRPSSSTTHRSARRSRRRSRHGLAAVFTVTGN
jgi:RNA polymerase sigma factor (sigma-70 family)